MKTDKLIDILAKDGKPVKPILHPFLRFSIWLFLSSLLMFMTFPLAEIFFGHSFHLNRDIAGSVILIVSTLLLGYFSFVLNRPVLLRPEVKFIIFLIFFLWIFRVFVGILSVEESAAEHLMLLYSGKPHAGCMTNTYLFFIIPFFIIIYMLRSGYSLDKTWAGFIAATASLSAAELMTNAMCPHVDPFHTLAWHIIPVIPIPLLAWFLSEKILERLRP